MSDTKKDKTTCKQFEESQTEDNKRGNRELAMKCNMEKDVAAKEQERQELAKQHKQEQEEFEKTHSVDKAGLSKQKMYTSDERLGGKRRRRRRKSRKSRRKSRKTKRKRRKSRKTKRKRRKSRK